MSSGEHVLCATHGPPKDPPGPQFPRRGIAGHLRMNSRICLCCGEPMPVKGNPLSRNPNICASCSSLADGMEDSNLPETTSETPREVAQDLLDQQAAEPPVHHAAM